jgi:hypothetical protein
VTLRHALVAALAAALLAACRDGGTRTFRPQPGIDRHPIVTTGASCDGLERAIEDAVVAAMVGDLEQLRHADVWVTATPGPAAPGASAGGPSDYTTTNAQVAGVDEADFVQNDGTRIAVLAGGALHLLNSWPADALAEAAAAPIEGWPRELFLSGGQAAVFSSLYVPRPGFGGFYPPCPMGPVGSTSIWCGHWGNDATKITLLDVSALDAPRVTAELLLPGSYLSSRRIGDRVRVVLADALPYPDGVRLWPDVPWYATGAERDRAFDALEAANEVVIRSMTLDDWLRHGSVTRPDGSTVELGYACEDFAVSSAPDRPGIVTVATIDLAAGQLVSHTSLLARGDLVYASRDTLYVAAAHRWWWPEPGQADATYLYAFDLRDPDRAPFLASGTVDGRVAGQYDLDELDGRLRVASTVHTRVDDGTRWGTVHRASRIAVLAPDAGALKEIGRTAPFGEDEELFGTRFVGTRGFAITARQVDPLFTFDLSDPASPTKVGEVAMPGFIAYLHPIDGTHLLGVGRERAAGGTGPMQVKVQLFDVTDLAKPVAGPPALVGEGWSWSESLWDPKAFTWLGARGVLAIPFADFASDRFVTDLRLFHVDPAAGITPLGSLSMADVYLRWTGWDFTWSPWVRRGILADDFVYAVSDAGVRSARVAELPAWLATVRFAPAATP